MKPDVVVCLTCTVETNAVVVYEDRENLRDHLAAETEHVYVPARRGA